MSQISLHFLLPVNGRGTRGVAEAVALAESDQPLATNLKSSKIRCGCGRLKRYHIAIDGASEEQCRRSSNTPSPEINDRIARSDDEVEQDMTGGESEAGLPPVSKKAFN
ncbi:unnamed protein product [Gongylonema pulchrum]|uniref:Uncharacterized protein n=1 Tax=Gongylonema pulchrum TaxID=637853 RepID=A0A183D7T7_9BILA|nr:unnamed protein product [Gongylonema pulchrum]